MQVVGLAAAPQNSGSYALILSEVGGDRRLTILIGQEPANSIAIELEAIRPNRPITHDLLKSVIEHLGARLVEVTITGLHEGTYYAVMKLDNSPNEIDARPSDAIAVAVRFGAPIYILESVLEQAANMVADDDLTSGPEEAESESARPLTRREQLENELEEAVNREDYEVAARIRDEIVRLDRAGTDL